MLQLTRKLLTCNGNLAKQRCHLHFNHRCKDHNVLPKSLRTRPLTRNNAGFRLAKRYGFKCLSMRISENHNAINKHLLEIDRITNIMKEQCNERLLRRITREVKSHYNTIFDETKERHISKLNKLINFNNNHKNTINENWVINMSKKKPQ